MSTPSNASLAAPAAQISVRGPSPNRHRNGGCNNLATSSGAGAAAHPVHNQGHLTPRLSSADWQAAVAESRVKSERAKELLGKFKPRGDSRASSASSDASASSAAVGAHNIDLVISTDEESDDEVVAAIQNTKVAPRLDISAMRPGSGLAAVQAMKQRNDAAKALVKVIAPGWPLPQPSLYWLVVTDIINSTTKTLVGVDGLQIAIADSEQVHEIAMLAEGSFDATLRAHHGAADPGAMDYNIMLRRSASNLVAALHGSAEGIDWLTEFPKYVVENAAALRDDRLRFTGLVQFGCHPMGTTWRNILAAMLVNERKSETRLLIKSLLEATASHPFLDMLCQTAKAALDSDAAVDSCSFAFGVLLCAINFIMMPSAVAATDADVLSRLKVLTDNDLQRGALAPEAYAQFAIDEMREVLFGDEQTDRRYNAANRTSREPLQLGEHHKTFADLVSATIKNNSAPARKFLSVMVRLVCQLPAFAATRGEVPQPIIEGLLEKCCAEREDYTAIKISIDYLLETLGHINAAVEAAVPDSAARSIAQLAADVVSGRLVNMLCTNLRAVSILGFILSHGDQLHTILSPEDDATFQALITHSKTHQSLFPLNNLPAELFVNDPAVVDVLAAVTN